MSKQQLKFLSVPFAKELKGLPLTETTNLNYGCQINKPAGKAINFALYLMDNHFEELSLTDIKRLLHEIMGCKVSRTTVMRWARVYRPNLNYRMSREHYPSWNKAISLSVWFIKNIGKQKLNYKTDRKSMK